MWRRKTSAEGPHNVDLAFWMYTRKLAYITLTSVTLAYYYVNTVHVLYIHNDLMLLPGHEITEALIHRSTPVESQQPTL